MTAPAPEPVMHYSEKPSIFPLDGGCACGKVRYRLERAPLVVHCCHCTACQRETGSAFGVNGLIETNAVTRLPSARPTAPSYLGRPDDFPACGPPIDSTDGASETATKQLWESQSQPAGVVEPVLITLPSESGYGQEVARCPFCGTMVWSHYSGSGKIMSFIRLGTLDRAWLVGPDVHIFTRSKRDFVTLPTDKPVYEQFYPNKEAVYRKEAMDRFKKLLPAINEYRRGRGFKEI